MKRTSLLVLAIALVALAGCGGDEERSAAPAATETAEAAKTPAAPERSPDEAEIAKVAKTYLDGFAAEDWKTVCATRTPKERRFFERKMGSCERGFELVADSKPGSTGIFADAEIGEVRIRGRVAGADVMMPGADEPATTLAAVRSGGKWLLEDVPDDKTP